MISNLKVYAVIPARSGSKSIKDKNILNFKGKPLFVHSIEQSLKSTLIDRVFVSTDSENYRKIAIANGAEAPFLRPSEKSADDSTDFDVFLHFIEWISENSITVPDIIVHLRQTYPTRPISIIDDAIKFFANNMDKADSLRTVVKCTQTPYKMWRKEGLYLKPLLEVEDIYEFYNLPRQKLPQVYWQNACVDIIKTDIILKDKTISGTRILHFEMDSEEINDIDDWNDFQKAEKRERINNVKNI